MNPLALTALLAVAQASTPGADWWYRAYVIFTGALVIIGAIGVGCAVVTLWAVRAQVTVMGEQRQVMLGQLRTMQEQITEMSGQTNVLEKSVAATEKNAEAAKASADAAKESIILSHRPRIAVRGVVLAWMPLLQRMTTVERLNKNRFDDGQLGGAFYIVNMGNQPATVIQLELYLSFDDYLPMEHPSESGRNRKVVEIRVEAGKARKLPFVPLAITSGNKDKAINLGATMHAIGKITYVDDLGNRRETGFCRQLDYARGKLVAVNDPDYEYMD